SRYSGGRCHYQMDTRVRTAQITGNRHVLEALRATPTLRVRAVRTAPAAHPPSCPQLLRRTFLANQPESHAAQSELDTGTDSCCGRWLFHAALRPPRLTRTDGVVAESASNADIAPTCEFCRARVCAMSRAM